MLRTHLRATNKPQRVQVRMTALLPLHLPAKPAQLKLTRLNQKMPRIQLTARNKLQPVQARLTTLRARHLPTKLVQLKLTRLSRKMPRIQLTARNKLQPVQARLTTLQVLRLQARRTELKPRIKGNRRAKRNLTMRRMVKVLQKSRLQLIHHRMPTLLNINQLFIHIQQPPKRRLKIPIQKARHITRLQPIKLKPRPILGPRLIPPTTSCIIVIRCRSRISRSQNKSAVTVVR